MKSPDTKTKEPETKTVTPQTKVNPAPKRKK